MIEILGKYNSAKIFTDIIDDNAIRQIQTLCDTQEFSKSKIRMMCDVHSGLGCCIGTTMTIYDKVVPSMVGVDIGCGMETIKLANKNIDFSMLDNIIRTYIPFGCRVRDDIHQYNEQIDLTKLRCFKKIKHSYAIRSLGSLGGGNHFIEVDKDDDGKFYLVIHSGSRHLGTEVAAFYQKEGLCTLKGNTKEEIEKVIKKLKEEGKENEIESTINHLRTYGSKAISVPEELAYVEGALFENYIHDMDIVQNFALLNRKAISDIITTKMKFDIEDSFSTIHNYIDTKSMILRKGAVSAQEGERLLIPINMRDGSLICIGKGNEDWNYSAPHGAGRILSRSMAIKTLSLEEFRNEMEGIFTTCVSKKTLDESPMAYKSLSSIVENITPTVSIEKRIIPVYNFKAQ